MPRSRSGGFGSRGSSFGSRGSGFGQRSSFAASRPMPAPMQSASRPGLFSGGLGSTLATGMAFGAGSEVAHQAIRGIMGPSYQPVYVQQMPGQGQGQMQANQMQQQQARQQICMKEINDFAQCIQTNDNNIGSCQKYSDMLRECKERSERK